jgi:CPA2 family monovalent cation:H+ antiporter-2
MHGTSLVTTLAAAFTAAWFFGLLARTCRLSPIVGYLLAGVLIGPHTPGFVGDVGVAQELAEIGVILLMFGVGLHFRVRDLMAVRGVAIPGAVGQSAAAVLLAMVIFRLFGVPLASGAMIGMALAVASTVVLMRALMDADVLKAPEGHVAVGWLIVEDIFTVILLVIIPVVGDTLGEARAAREAVAASQAVAAAVPGAPAVSLWPALGLALLKLVALVAVVLFAGSRIVPWVLVWVVRLRSRELFTLTVLVCSIAVAAAAYYFFGASMALGAFMAGMVVAQSPVSHQAAADALPMRDAFAVLFFVSVGMLFDPAFVVQEPGLVAAALGIVLVGKPLAALLIVAALGRSVRTALTVALGLAQIGEFSFILAALCERHGLTDASGANLLIATAIVSISINPWLFRRLPAIEAWLRGRPRLWRALNGRAEIEAMRVNRDVAEGVAAPGTPDERLGIVVGYGPVGQTVHRILRDAGLATVVVDLNMDTVSALTSKGQPAIFGDASHELILEQAGMRRASYLVLTLPHSTDRVAVVAAARTLNPSARILVRARYLREREDLEAAGATATVYEESEAAVALSRMVLADTRLARRAAESTAGVAASNAPGS